MAGPASASHGATFVVTTTVDAADVNPGDDVCAASSSGCTLRAAVMEANALPDANVISLEAPAPAVYRLTIAGQGEDSGAIGDLDLKQDVDIVGRGPDQDTIDAAALDRVLHVLGAGTTATVTGLTITGGKLANSEGGGVLNAADLRIEDSVVKDNFSSSGGGISSSGTSLSIADTLLESNGSSGQAGGISISAPSSTPPSNTVFTFADSELRNNIAASVGGGLVVALSPPLRYEVLRSSLIGNSANAGGGLWNNATESSTPSVIRDTTVAQNSSSDTNCDYGSGPIYSPRSVANRGTGPTCSAAAEGGGLVNIGTLALNNDTVILNSANKGGGGIAGGTSAIVGHTTVANTIVAMNTNETVADNCINGPLTSLGGNIDSMLNDCGFDSDVANPDADGDRTGVDPQLGPVQSDAFGVTSFYPPLPGSPAIDAGSDLVCTPDDQLGQPRPADGNGDAVAVCDIGAIELYDKPAACDRFGAVCGTGGDDEVQGTDGDDILVGGPGDDHIVCGGGNDKVFAGEGNDTVECGSGDDEIDGGPGDDLLVGGPGDDTFNAGDGDDEMFGDTQEEPGPINVARFAGSQGKDKLRGEGGDDFGFGGGAFDRLFGGGGKDRLWGGSGDDTVEGEDGPDKLYGQDGGDELDGGKGPDQLRAGDGRDLCLVGDLDTVTDGCEKEKRAHKRAH
jgi:CSLREA domain-containing protein